MATNFRGPGVLVVPDGRNIDVHAVLVLKCPRNDLWSWSGTVTTQKADGSLLRAMDFNSRLILRFKGDDLEVMLDGASASKATSWLRGRNGSWPSFGPQSSGD